MNSKTTATMSHSKNPRKLDEAESKKLLDAVFDRVVTVTTAHGLIEMVKAGNQAGFNRQAEVATIAASIDTEMRCLEVFRMIHEHIGGERVEPHFRSIWMFAIRNRGHFTSKSAPVRITIDCDMETHKTHTTQMHITEDEATLIDQEVRP